MQGVVKHLIDFCKNQYICMHARLQLNRVMKKSTFCICENKGADQLRSNCAADQHLSFHYRDCTINILSKSDISSIWPLSVVVHLVFCRTLSETLKTGFLATRLNFIIMTFYKMSFALIPIETPLYVNNVKI